MRGNNFIYVYRRWSHVFVFFVSEACFCENPGICFLYFCCRKGIYILMDVENRPNGLTINIFIGRQVGAVVHKSD